MNERRKDLRHPVQIAATIKLGKKLLSGRMMNASFNGLAIQLPDAPGTRQLVQVELSLPGGEKFSAHAMVIHGGATHVGLEFFGRSARPSWDNFVQQLARGIVPPAAPSPVPEAEAPKPPPPAAPIEPAMMVPSIVSGAGGPPITVPLGFGGPQRPPPPPPPRSNPGIAPPLPGQAPPLGAPIAPPLGAPIAPPLPPSGFASPPAPPAPPPPPEPRPPAPYAGPDRRRAPRIELRIELRMRTPRAALESFTTNISMTGILAIVNDPNVAAGEPVAINLLQPGTSVTFRRDGMITRVQQGARGFALGIDFAPVDSMQEVLFADFLNASYMTLTSGR